MLVGHISCGDHDGAHSWAYNLQGGEYGPASWPTSYPEACAGKKQSPVNIPTDDLQFNEGLEDIDLEGTDAGEGKTMVLFNNGHTAQVNVMADVDIVGGNLGDVYKVAQLHFHWGNNDSRGSEHTVDGKPAPLEMHVVTYDAQKYDNLLEAADKARGLAVFSVLFQISEDDNKEIDPVINNLEKVLHPNAAHKEPIDWLNLGALLPRRTYRYYRYDGSLTTPNCYESVVWTVFADRQTVSASQLAKFRTLHEGEEEGEMSLLVDNFRPTQPLNGRKVQASFMVQEAKYKIIDVASLEESNGSMSSSAVNILGVLVCSTIAVLFQSVQM